MYIDSKGSMVKEGKHDVPIGDREYWRLRAMDVITQLRWRLSSCVSQIASVQLRLLEMTENKFFTNHISII